MHGQKASHTDIPLSELTAPEIEKMVRHWESRPKARLANGKLSNRMISVETVYNMVKHLRRFLNWLQDAEQFKWSIGDRVIVRSTKLRKRQELMTSEERKRIGRGPDSWALEELTELYKHATQRETLYLLLGLNAGFAQSELCYLTKAEVNLEDQPPHLDYIRHKSSRRGGAKLWPQTVDALRRLWSRQKPANAQAGQWAILSEAGTRLTAGRIANAWNGLLDRVQKDYPTFRRLPFKYLRKTNAQLHQDQGNAVSEIIAVMQARAKWTIHDEQADVYYRRNFAAVYDANDRVYAYLQPMFAAKPTADELEEVEPPIRPKVQPEDIQHAMDQKRSATAVARELGISRPTVYRHIGRRTGGRRRKKLNTSGS